MQAESNPAGVPEFTTVVAVDAEHVRQLDLVWPTWMRHRPELRENRLLLLCDTGRGHSHAWWRGRLEYVFEDCRLHGRVGILDWDWPAGTHLPAAEITQRERMLTALVHLPAMYVNTDYWLKLDTDAVALRGGEWIRPEWFADRPVLISSPWGYGKPADVVEVLDRWGDAHPELARFSPLGHRPQPGSDIVHYPRIISWCCWVEREFSRWASRLCSGPGGWGRLPVPSQDTFHHYVATRTHRRVQTVRMKQFGWDHVRKHKTLATLCAEALR